MDIEKNIGYRSSFNFAPEQYNVSPQLRRKLVKAGFEIGLHGLHHRWKLYYSEKIFQYQAKRINNYLKQWGAVGFRAPFMQHNLDLNHYLNIEYDASTFDTDPFEPQSDGVGTIYPFCVAGDLENQKYIELPYTLPQDFTLFVLMEERDIKIWREKLDWIAECGGMALINTHPDYMDFTGKEHCIDEYPVTYYSEFLKYVKTKYEGHYWHVLPKDISRFWMDQVVVHNQQKKRKTSKSIRACMVTYSFYENDNRVKRYAEALAQRGDYVDVIALKKDGYPYRENMNGVNIYRIQKRPPHEDGKWTYLFRLIKFLIHSSFFLAKHHIKNPYSLIHVHSVPDFEVFAALYPKFKGAGVILDIHDIVPEFYASKFRQNHDTFLFKMLTTIEKASTAFADHVIISNDIWHDALCRRSVEKKKCTTILNYPDENIFHVNPITGKDNGCTIVYPGTFGWHQGLDIAIRAFAMIKNVVPEAIFHIYGRGSEENNLKSLITQFDLQDRVFLHSILPVEQIAEIMANADIGIVPKRNDPFGGEAFSTKILEFMVLGIPVIVADTKIDKYYFNDSVVKFFKAGDEKDLASAMIELIKDPELRKKITHNAWEFIKDNTWETKKSLYLDLVDTIVKKKHKQL